MQKTYRFLAYSIAVLVVVQAGAIAWAFFGLSDWISNDNGVLNKQVLECESDCDSLFTAEWGFAIHMFFVGLVLIPLVSLILLIVSFFAKIPGGIKYAAGIFLLIVLQVIVLPALSREVDPGFGALHGINALILLGMAAAAGRRAGVRRADETPAPAVA
jgi:hypothetical protein